MQKPSVDELAGEEGHELPARHARVAEDCGQDYLWHCAPALDEQIKRGPAQRQLVQEHDDAGGDQPLSHYRPSSTRETVAQRNHRGIIISRRPRLPRLVNYSADGGTPLEEVGVQMVAENACQNRHWPVSRRAIGQTWVNCAKALPERGWAPI